MVPRRSSRLAGICKQSSQVTAAAEATAIARVQAVLAGAFGIPAKPGLWNFLKVIEKRRLPAAVATSSDAGQVRMSLQAAGLNQRFSCIVTGDQVPKGKPAPDIFLEAARRLGSLPRHCLVLEDSEAGVLAATAAGMPVLLIPDLKQPSPSTAALAYRVFPSLKEATDFVERAFDE